MPAESKPALLVRLRPTGPWRIGPDTGERDRIDRILHSDTLYSAVSSAMHALGVRDEWFAATAQSESGPAVSLTSCYPWQHDQLFAVPPTSIWPPAPSVKVRWKSARFVPLKVIATVAAEKNPDENNWWLDPISECLLPVDPNKWISGPFRITTRCAAAVDRLSSGNIDPYRIACLEFSENSGIWTMAVFSSDADRDTWQPRLEAAFRYLADSGLGGERSRGWGRSEAPKFESVQFPDFFLPQQESSEATESSYWLLSLFTPSSSDPVDWKRGSYSVVTRGGRIESHAGWGRQKKQLRMIAEGSVVSASTAPRGSAPDVSPEGFPHPVFHAGFAVAVPLPPKGATA